jgi:hypothetical protein
VMATAPTVDSGLKRDLASPVNPKLSEAHEKNERGEGKEDPGHLIVVQ